MLAFTSGGIAGGTVLPLGVTGGLKGGVPVFVGGVVGGGVTLTTGGCKGGEDGTGAGLMTFWFGVTATGMVAGAEEGAGAVVAFGGKLVGGAITVGAGVGVAAGLGGTGIGLF